jgi:hypothetical protein
VFENSVLRRLFGPKRDDVMGEWRKLHRNFIICTTTNNNNNPRRYSSDEPWPAEQPPLAVFPDCTRRYWVDVVSTSNPTAAFSTF